jgi:hypothetical protein
MTDWGFELGSKLITGPHLAFIKQKFLRAFMEGEAFDPMYLNDTELPPRPMGVGDLLKIYYEVAGDVVYNMEHHTHFMSREDRSLIYRRIYNVRRQIVGLQIVKPDATIVLGRREAEHLFSGPTSEVLDTPFLIIHLLYWLLPLSMRNGFLSGILQEARELEAAGVPRWKINVHICKELWFELALPCLNAVVAILTLLAILAGFCGLGAQ